jgi:hypothetical protein
LIVLGTNGFFCAIRYFDSHKTDFDNVNFSQITLPQWLRLEAYTRLRNSLPETKTNILAFFTWATARLDEAEKAKLSEKIAELTLWKKKKLKKSLPPSISV